MLLDELYQMTKHMSSTQWDPCSEPLSVEPKSQLHPSIVKPPKVELKHLPEHFKYAYHHCD